MALYALIGGEDTVLEGEVLHRQFRDAVDKDRLFRAGAQDVRENAAVRTG